MTGSPSATARSGAEERRDREVGAGARGADVAQRDDEQHEADAVGEEPDDHRGADVEQRRERTRRARSASARFTGPATRPLTAASQVASCRATLRVRLLSMPHARHAPRIASVGQIPAKSACPGHDEHDGAGDDRRHAERDRGGRRSPGTRTTRAARSRRPRRSAAATRPRPASRPARTSAAPARRSRRRRSRRRAAAPRRGRAARARAAGSAGRRRGRCRSRDRAGRRAATGRRRRAGAWRPGCRRRTARPRRAASTPGLRRRGGSHRIEYAEGSTQRRRTQLRA